MCVKKEWFALSPGERGLWLISVAVVAMAGVLGGQTTAAGVLGPVIGVTALIYIARGAVLGQVLMVVFSLVYGYLSFYCRYYGEMVTYMGMTGPISAMTVVTWLRHPSQEENQVEAARLSPRLRWIMAVSAAGTTWAFYYILKYFHTAQLPLSTLSVTTSFLASYLMLFRSSMYAVAYAANDLVLIGLWVLAARNDPANWSMAICFAMFFCNDLYGFVSWRRRQRQQEMLKAQQEN